MTLNAAGEVTNFDNWKVSREIGRGGQGVAYHVKSIRGIAEPPEKIILDALTLFVGSYYPNIRASASAGIVNAMQQICAAAIALDHAPEGALKSLHSANFGDTWQEKAVSRLRHEIDALHRISHRAIVNVIDSKPERLWFVMEYLAGGTLHDNLSGFRGDALKSLVALRPIIEAVALLHKDDIVHRDIKPSNIFLGGPDRRLVLGDFGLAFILDANHRLTESFENVGSKEWMPGWAMGMRLENVHPTFDVFTLGKVLWSMVSGQEFLRLWYHDHPEFDLERRFPSDPDIRWITRILNKCVVEHELDCLPTASDLLVLCDEAIFAIRRKGQVLRVEQDVFCGVCGIGTSRGNFEGGDGDVRLICNNCGHIETFVRALNKPAWNGK